MSLPNSDARLRQELNDATPKFTPSHQQDIYCIGLTNAENTNKRNLRVGFARTVGTKALSTFAIFMAVCVAFLPFQIASAEAAKQTQDAEPGVEMCYYADGPGQEVSGLINGRPFTNHARVFKVKVDDIEQDAFCTDLHNPIGTKQCHGNSQIGVTDPKVACVLQNYPPDAITDDNEAAAVQSAIWHFSDGFELSPSEDIFGRYQSIVADVEAKYASGVCTPIDNWQLSVEMDDEVHFLQPIGDGYRPDQHLIYIKLLASDLPVANHPLTVSTDVGNLSWASERGSQISVVTDQNGAAVVAIAYDQPGIATIDVHTTTELPVGTRIDPGPAVQKLVISGTDSFPLHQQEQAEWVGGEKLVVKKFHDINRDGLFNHTDELMNWRVEVCEAGTDDCFESELGDDGTRIFALDPTTQYNVCEIERPDWTATTDLCQQNLSLPANVWFGNVELPSLLIEKFHDLNGNGLQDAGEPGIVGWPFQIMRQNGEEMVATYSGNTGVGGRLGYANVDYHTYQVDELFPSGETWYASTAESQTVAINDKKPYTLTFGNLKPATLTVGKKWLVDSVEVTPPAGTVATACLRRTGPGDVTPPMAPSVNGVALTPNAQGLYCTDQLVDEVTFENVWPGTYELIEVALEGWTPVVVPSPVSIVSGGEYALAGFVNSTTTAAIGDFVWFDRNQNGLQDSGERGVADVVVYLHSPVDGKLAQTTTDSFGQYIFDNLPSGDYFLEFEIPAGYTVSPPNQTQSGNPESDTIDSDVDINTGKTEVTTLMPSEFDMSWDAGIFKETSPSFQFEKYINGNDADTIEEAVLSERNQILSFRYEVVNDGDVPLIWSILLDDVFGDLSGECGLPIEIGVGQTESCTVTRLAGSFPAGKVNIGTVTLSEGTPPDLPPVVHPPLPTKSDPAWYMTIEPTIRLEPAELGDRVWLDTNENGIQEQGEEGVPGITVILLSDEGVTLDVMTTDEQGFYLFDDLSPDRYIVEFSIPYGYTLTAPFQGPNPFVDSNAEYITHDAGRTPPVDLETGESDLSIDAGLIMSPPILKVNKVPTEDVATPGSLVRYTIDYTNIGGSDAVDVVITELVPQYTTFAQEQSDAGWNCEANTSGSICRYNVGHVPANSVSNTPILFTVRVDDPLPITVTKIANQIAIMDNEESKSPTGPVGVGTPPVLVDIEQGVLGTPPIAEPMPDVEHLVPVIYLPLVE